MGKRIPGIRSIKGKKGADVSVCSLFFDETEGRCRKEYAETCRSFKNRTDLSDHAQAYLQWIDEIAGIVSKRHAGVETTTASIDNLNFKAAAFLNDMVVLIGRLTYVGSSSMEVRVDTYVEGLDGIRRVINRAHVVMVALDENGYPIKVPALKIETEAEKAEWESGEKRYKLRKQRRIEGF